MKRSNRPFPRTWAEYEEMYGETKAEHMRDMYEDLEDAVREIDPEEQEE